MRGWVSHLCGYMFADVCFQPLMDRELWKGHQIVALWANILCWKGFPGGPGCFVLSGYSTDDCQPCGWYTFTQAHSVNSFTQDSQNITDGKLTSLSSFVLFSVQKGASFINDQPTWRKTFRITQPHFSCLMRRLHVCLLSINYSGFTALESPSRGWVCILASSEGIWTEVGWAQGSGSIQGQRSEEESGDLALLAALAF